MWICYIGDKHLATISKYSNKIIGRLKKLTVSRTLTVTTQNYHNAIFLLWDSESFISIECNLVVSQVYLKYVDHVCWRRKNPENVEAKQHLLLYRKVEVDTVLWRHQVEPCQPPKTDGDNTNLSECAPWKCRWQGPLPWLPLPHHSPSLQFQIQNLYKSLFTFEVWASSKSSGDHLHFHLWQIWKFIKTKFSPSCSILDSGRIRFCLINKELISNRRIGQFWSTGISPMATLA